MRKRKEKRWRCKGWELYLDYDLVGKAILGEGEICPFCGFWDEEKQACSIPNKLDKPFRVVTNTTLFFWEERAKR